MPNTLKCPSTYSYDHNYSAPLGVKEGTGRTEKAAQADALSKFAANAETLAKKEAIDHADRDNDCEGDCALDVTTDTAKYTQTNKVTNADKTVTVTVQLQVPVTLSCAKRKVAVVISALADVAPIEDFVIKAFEDKSLTEIADAPIFALQGVSESDAELLQQAFNIKTVRDLANLKFFRWAQDIVSRAETEDSTA